MILPSFMTLSIDNKVVEERQFPSIKVFQFTIEEKKIVPHSEFINLDNNFKTAKNTIRYKTLSLLMKIYNTSYEVVLPKF